MFLWVNRTTRMWLKLQKSYPITYRTWVLLFSFLLESSWQVIQPKTKQNVIQLYCANTIHKCCSTCTPTFSKLGNAPLTFSITSFTLHKIKYNTAWSYKLIQTKKGNQWQGQENHNSLAYYYCSINISLSLVSSIVNWVWGIVCVLSPAVSFSNQRLS